MASSGHIVATPVKERIGQEPFMKNIASSIVVALVSSSAFAFTDLGNGTYRSDGTAADTQAAINAAADGYTVQLPSGSFTWARGVSVSGKGIHIQGGGSGRIIARSTSIVAVGNGAKAFTTQSGLRITAGQTLRISETGARANYMEGTVTSYSGTTLVMKITSTGGSGTPKRWLVSTVPTTTIVHNTIDTALFVFTEDATHSIELSGIKIAAGTSKSFAAIYIVRNDGKPVLIHDCWFAASGDGGGVTFQIQTNSNRGVVWNCSFDASPFAQSPSVFECTNSNLADSWSSPSTMGMTDTNGMSNFYIEDCDFHAWLNATDFGDNSKGVLRRCLLNNTGLGTHGADTGEIGVRHYEFYDNEFVFNGYSDGTTFPLNQWFYLRGGTGVIADNITPEIHSQDYPHKYGVNMTVMQLQRAAGPDMCHGANVPGIQYPATRQVGMGRVTGTAGNDSVTYKGDSEPLYIWGNTAGLGVSTSNFGGNECVNPDSSVDYIVSGRDFFNDGTAKPGYTKYTYPHPLRSSKSSSGLPSPPDKLRVVGP